MPGAILPQEKPEECTVKQLQGWLLCHEAKTIRKKTQLIQRKACTDLEVPEVICTQKTQQLVCLVTFKVAVLAQSGSKATAKRQIICKTQHLYCTRHSVILITFDCIIPRFRAWAQSISVLSTQSSTAVQPVPPNNPMNEHALSLGPRVSLFKLKQ